MRLLDKVRLVIRKKHYKYSIEEAYIKRKETRKETGSALDCDVIVPPSGDKSVKVKG